MDAPAAVDASGQLAQGERAIVRRERVKERQRMQDRAALDVSLLGTHASMMLGASARVARASAAGAVDQEEEPHADQSCAVVVALGVDDLLQCRCPRR